MKMSSRSLNTHIPWASTLNLRPHLYTSIFISFALSIFASLQGRAAGGSWISDAGGNWDSPTNWNISPAVPGSLPGDIINLTANITANRTIVSNVPATFGIVSIGDSNGTHSYTVSGTTGGLLRFDNSGDGAQLIQVSASGNNAISAAIVLNDNLTVNNASAKELAIGSSGQAAQITELDGERSITIESTGTGATVIYSNTNSFSGGMYVNSGTLQARGATGLGTGTIYLGATSGVANVTLKGNSGGATTPNNITVRSGNTGTCTIQPASIGSSPSFFSGAVSLQKDLYLDHLNVISTAALSFSGSFSGSNTIRVVNSSGTPAGTGSYIGLNGNSPDFTGNVEIGENAVLRLAGTAALTASNPVLVNPSGSLRLATVASHTIAGLNGNGGTVSRITTGNGTLTLGGSGSYNFNGIITDGTSNSILNLRKAGSGTQTLGGTLGYTGSTTVTSGSLVINGDLISTSAMIVSGGCLTVNGNVSHIGEVTVSGGSLVVNGNLSGSGTTSVSSGTLLVSGDIGADRILNVSGSGLLTGPGAIAGAVNISGGHSPEGVQTFLSTLTYSTNATVTWELRASTDLNSGINFDQILVGGNLVFAGPTSLTLSFGGNVTWEDGFWSQPHTWLLYDVAGSITDPNNLILSSDWSDSEGFLLGTARPGWTFILRQDGSRIYLDYLQNSQSLQPTILPPFAYIPMAAAVQPFPSDYALPPVSFLLWQDGAPGTPEPLHKGWNGSSIGTSGAESAQIVAVSNWGYPALDVWRPLTSGSNRKAVVICPGGAYQALSIDWRTSVDAFLQNDYVVFMLRYRTVPNPQTVETYALLDAKRALRFIRTYSSLLGVDPDRIGVVGASAGSNLVLNLITHPDAGNPEDPDILERPGCHVAFAIMLCPWPTSYNRPASFYPVTATTPPSFIASAKDDTGAPPSFAVNIAAEYDAAAAPNYLWRIDSGGHLAFHSQFHGEGSQWFDTFLAWLNQAGVNFPVGYFDWAARHELSGANSSLTADPDSDGYNNTAEFAFGTNPVRGDNGSTLLTSDSGQITLNYLQRSGVAYIVWATNDLRLGFHQTVIPVMSYPQPLGLESGYDQWEVAMPTDTQSFFLKVEAIIQP